ncbi:MAG TPA: GGDEF domain-containing protein [Candidatus Nitrosotalea sp.]|nr:GGDEF domain-containing protein [Candidatus Nitrosotalea sp.]
MKTKLRSVLPAVVVAFLGLPLPLPVPTPGGLSVPVLPSVSATPLSLPTLLPTVSSSSSALPSVGATPAASSAGAPLAGGGVPSATGGAGTSGAPDGGTPPARGLPIPFTTIVISSPLDVALAVALASLPLLLGIWLLVFGRTFASARRAREAQLRLALAGDLGLRPRELTSLNTKALFKLREQAAFDDLTGALRRGAGISAIDREVARARRHKSPLSLAFVDIDGLKAVNDRRGHAAGDRLIRGLAEALKQGLRDQDLLVRYGGDEFVCVLPDTPAEAGVAKLSEIRTAAAKAGLRFSVGLTALQRSDDVVSLLARADRELYLVKARRGDIVQLPPGRQGGSRKSRITA